LRRAACAEACVSVRILSKWLSVVSHDSPVYGARGIGKIPVGSSPTAATNARKVEI